MTTNAEVIKNFTTLMQLTRGKLNSVTPDEIAAFSTESIGFLREAVDNLALYSAVIEIEIFRVREESHATSTGATL